MNIKQIETSSCKTIYEIGPWQVCLQITCYTGVPTLQFMDYTRGCFARFDTAEHKRWNRTNWDSDKGCYAHQNPDNIQGPTFHDLPNGLKDIEKFLLDYVPKREAAIAEEEERDRLRALGLNPDKNKWAKREAEKEPRILKGHKRDDGGFVISGKEIGKVLKKAGKILNLDGCIFATTILRQYATIWRKESLIVYPPNGANEIKLTVPDCRNKATIKHGARDKYRGLNGYHAKLRLVEIPFR